MRPKAETEVRKGSPAKLPGPTKHPRNSSGYYELWLWEPRGEDDWLWRHLVTGSKEGMLWVLKGMVAMLISFIGPPKGWKELCYMVAVYMVLSPDNEPVPVPRLVEIQRPGSSTPGELPTANWDLIMDFLDKLPPMTIIYEDRR